MSHQNRLRKLAAAAALVAGFSGCGGHSYYEPALGNVPGSSTPPIFGGTGATGPTGSTTGLLPPLSSVFSETGSNTYTQTVTTDNLLKVRITALPAGQNISSGANGAYSCITFQVTAAGMPVTTTTLGVNGGGAFCPGASSEQIIDFSGNMTPGHGPISVTVKAINYDYYINQCNDACYGPMANYNSCATWTGGFVVSCGWYWTHSIYSQHTVSGKLDIQVNGTSL